MPSVGQRGPGLEGALFLVRRSYLLTAASHGEGAGALCGVS